MPERALSSDQRYGLSAFLFPQYPPLLALLLMLAPVVSVLLLFCSLDPVLFACSLQLLVVFLLSAPTVAALNQLLMLLRSLDSFHCSQPPALEML